MSEKQTPSFFVAVTGKILIIGIILLGIGSIKKIPDFIDIPSIVFVLGFLFASWLMAFRISDIYKSILGMAKARFQSKQSKNVAINVCKVGAVSSFFGGIIGTIIGLCLIFSNEKATDLRYIVSCLSVGLITSLYGCFLALMFYIAKVRSMYSEVSE